MPRVSLLSSAPNINDPGSTTLSSATIKIANASGNAVAGDKLFVNGIENGSLGNGVTASWNATTNTLTLDGNRFRFGLRHVAERDHLPGHGHRYFQRQPSGPNRHLDDQRRDQFL